MDVLIAQSWISSATRLSAADARRAWEFYEKYEHNPAHPSLSLERITQARDKNTWSGRISQGLRAVLHQDGETRAVLYAGPHDDAYAWASTHAFERNAATGVLQIVESPEVVARQVPALPARVPGLFDTHDDAYLLSLGLPTTWLPVIRKIAVDAVTTWDDYRRASRAGRGMPLSVKDRQLVWAALERLQTTLRDYGVLDFPSLCRRARELLQTGAVASPYDAIIVDEVQDLGPRELLLVAALAGSGCPDHAAGAPLNLTLVGDGGQRVYGRATSLKALGIDVRGRSHVLRLNYRTTEQIRRFADRIVREQADNLDGERDDRGGVRNLFGGPEPVLRGFANVEAEYDHVAGEIGRLLDRQQDRPLDAGEIAVFARRNSQLEELRKRLRAARLPCAKLGTGHEGSSSQPGGVTLATMHRAKGLEYKAVFIVGVSDTQIPEGQAYRNLTDPIAREEALQREKQLLYVSITRTRDEVYLTWASRRSRFLPSD